MDRLQELFHKYYEKTATAAERTELAALLAQEPDDTLADLISQEGERLLHADQSLAPQVAGQMLAHILRSPAKVRHLWPVRAAAAAAVLIAVATGGYFLLRPAAKAPHTAAHQDIQPGQTGAVLTLGDGTVVALDSAAAGLIARQQGTTVTLDAGQLAYHTGENGEVTYNLLQTPRGRQFKVLLPDSTVVWLNAGSSLRYPTAFRGQERRVKLEGEGYFDVHRDAARPFRVEAAGTEVTALGTEFNINAYANEHASVTTLTEGKVRVKRNAYSVELAPGRQSVAAYAKNDLQEQAAVNIEETIAWKEGNFYFDNATLQEILRQFERWYDIEVVYEGKVSSREFFVIISRKSTLSAVLRLLQDGGVRYRIEGRRLYVQSDK